MVCATVCNTTLFSTTASLLVMILRQKALNAVVSDDNAHSTEMMYDWHIEMLGLCNQHNLCYFTLTDSCIQRHLT